jgi:hypothetical protein
MEVFIIGPTVSQAIEVIQEYKIGRISYWMLPKPSQYIFLEVQYCFHVFEMNYISASMVFDSSAQGRAFRCEAQEAARGWRKFSNKGHRNLDHHYRHEIWEVNVGRAYIMQRRESRTHITF